MEVLYFKDFMKKYKLKNDIMNESILQRIYNYKIYPRDSKIITDKGFVNYRQWLSRRNSLELFFYKREKILLF